MSEKPTQAQAEQIKLLRGADERTLPERICQDSADFSYDALAALCDDGVMKADKHDAIANRCFHNIRITPAGRTALARLSASLPRRLMAICAEKWDVLIPAFIALVGIIVAIIAL
ncbi:MAG: hypothetical protein A2045_15830 [Rhodocyclales bacterium GWA2_65_20]|nr:MAG: hypothetical protein A2045_15830 [Rhodocyclales bacterium GWA2_65_20]